MATFDWVSGYCTNTMVTSAANGESKLTQIAALSGSFYPSYNLLHEWRNTKL